MVVVSSTLGTTLQMHTLGPSNNTLLRKGSSCNSTLLRQGSLVRFWKVLRRRFWGVCFNATPCQNRDSTKKRFENWFGIAKTGLIVSGNFFLFIAASASGLP